MFGKCNFKNEMKYLKDDLNLLEKKVNALASHLGIEFDEWQCGVEKEEKEK